MPLSMEAGRRLANRPFFSPFSSRSDSCDRLSLAAVTGTSEVLGAEDDMDEAPLALVTILLPPGPPPGVVAKGILPD